MSDKPIPTPYWWKNTYFWIAAILFMIGFLGIAIGQDSVRDPGQKREDGLALIYFGGALVMLVNGFLSHKQTVQHYNEQGGSSSQEGA